MANSRAGGALKLLFVCVGLGFPLLAFNGMEPRWFMPFVAIALSFVGAGFVGSFKDYKDRITGLDGSGKPHVNKTYALFLFFCIPSLIICYWIQAAFL